MPGQDGANGDDIDKFAQHTANNEHRREYERTYAEATAMKENGHTPQQIRQALIREPEQPKPEMHGQGGMIDRMFYAAVRDLADIRRRAVEDALQAK